MKKLLLLLALIISIGKASAQYSTVLINNSSSSPMMFGKFYGTNTSGSCAFIDQTPFTGPFATSGYSTFTPSGLTWTIGPAPSYICDIILMLPGGGPGVDVTPRFDFCMALPSHRKYTFSNSGTMVTVDCTVVSPSTLQIDIY